MSKTIRMLGIDPALRNTGLAVGNYNIDTGNLDVFRVELAKTDKGGDGKVVRKSSDDLRRARIIVAAIQSAVKLHRPHIAVAEVPGGCQSARGAFSNGICCGVLASLGVPLVEVSPDEVKLASVGNKTAPKSAIIQWATQAWPNAGWSMGKYRGQIKLLDENEHMADACAAIAAGLLTAQFAQAVAMMTAMAGIPATEAG